MASIQAGQTLPAVAVSQKGEVLLDGGKTTFVDWNTDSLKGKVRVVHHVAGRSAAKEINEALIQALKAADFPKETYQTTTIVNVKDAVFGTGTIVSMMVESGKKEFPWSCVVVDGQGTVQKAWGLKSESSAVAMLDAKGKVLFFKEGALAKQEIDQVLTLIEEHLVMEGSAA